MRDSDALRLVLLLTVSTVALLAAQDASAQTFANCPAASTTEVVTCTIDEGANVTGADVSATTSSPAEYQLNNNADIVATTGQEGTIITVYIDGDAGSTDGSDTAQASGVDGGTIVINNDGSLTLNGQTSVTNFWQQLIGIDARGTGGSGVEPDDNGEDGGRGGDGGTITITNNAAITIAGAAGDRITAQAIGINAQSDGGDGGAQNSGAGDQIGGNGGDGKDVTVTNSGAIMIGSETEVFNGNTAARGINAEGTGGTGGTDNGNGGSGGAPIVTNIGAIGIWWQGQDATTGGVVGIRAASVGSDGLASFDNSDNGGNGEQGKEGVVTNSADITLRVGLPVSQSGTSNVSAGIYAVSKGGDGGTSADKSTGGVGGSGSNSATGSGTGVTTITHNTATIDVDGPSVAGIVARSEGGNGGDGNGDSDSTGGAGGFGGQIQVNLGDGGTVVTAGDNGYAVLGQSIGGIGGSDAGSAGAGGAGGPVGVFASGGTTIRTSGDFANGITLHSVGGGGGVGGDFFNVIAGSGGDGGNGGNAGQTEVTSGAAITTTGDHAIGVLTQSVGGSGGAGGLDGSLLVSLGGQGGDGGTGANALINNTGAIITSGYGADGLVAQSLAGGGGAAGVSAGLLIGVGGSAGNTGTTYDGTAQVTNSGNVTTTGDAAYGIVAQSIGGGGGSGKGTTGVFAVGGSGGAGGAGGPAAVFAVGGTISTAGEFSHGLIAQSVGGGGGNGGNVLDFSVGTPSFGVGGQGSGGGSAGVVCISNFYTGSCATPVDATSNAPQQSASVITTTGDYAFGAIAQSIGGGGGNGGNATGASDFSIVNVQVGGKASGGGSGGETSAAFANLTLSTAGANAVGLLAQSVGGGGGNGGSSTAFSVQDLVPVQVGGGAGVGGNGSVVGIGLTGSAISTTGSSAAAIVAQSIGGGGGTGGSASGKTADLGFTFVTAVGASGGTGGAGNSATAALADVAVSTGIDGNGDVIASATNSIGIVVQSIGGGGGMGGASATDAIVVAIPDFEGESFEASTSIAVGGKGGSGGDGESASATLSGATAVVTGGDGSFGVVVQSIGGGGGNAGGADALTATIGDADTYAANGTVAVGNNGGSGGGAGNASVTLSNQASVTTFGDYASAVVVQSIGGGGGNAGIGSAVNDQVGGGLDVSANLSLGGSGGSSGFVGEASVSTVRGTTISTSGSGARGILAQSIGGGGGTATGGTVGLSASEGGGGGGGDDEDDSLSAAVTVGVGFTGGTSLSAGNVDVDAYAAIVTLGDDADGVLAQSIGGGGGLGGSVGDDAGSDGSDRDDSDEMTFDATVSVGGKGGSGSNGGTVNVVVGYTINTTGDYADGMVAQSIGGGGGAGGTAAAEGTTSKAQIDVGVGGSGGTGGSGGSVVVSLDDDGGGTGVATAGRHAHALLLQSIGGGGGQGADGSEASTGSISVGAGVGGSGGGSGNGGAVTITSGSYAGLTTTGDDSYAVLAQSIGGGGGVGAAGNAEGADGDDNYAFDVAVGGAGGASGNGGAVNLTLAGPFTTRGDRAFGIVAQSIGGGGGIGGAADGSNLASVSVGGKGGASGNGGTVTIDFTSGSINTSGDGAHAIIAQSIGGGGGIGGDASGGVLGVRGITGGDAGSGAGGTVSVSVNGSVTTTGTRAHGIIAQSIAGGGGITGSADGVQFGNIGSGGNSVSGPVSVTQTGSLSTRGEGSIGIFAQSQGVADDALVSVTINGAVTGGAGTDGVGVFVQGGDNNVATVEAGASVTAGDTDALAFRYDGEYASANGARLDVYNYGTVTGAFDFIATDSSSSVFAGTFHNETGGTYIASTESTGNIVNSGTLDLTGTAVDATVTQATAIASPATASAARVTPAPGTFELTGNFTQESTGVLLVSADFAGGRATRMEVSGNVRLDGSVKIETLTLLRDRPVSVIVAGGDLTGEITATVSRAVDFEAGTRGSTVRVSAVDTDFGGAFDGLSENERQAGAHLDALFDARSRRYAELLATLNNLAEGDPFGVAYARALASLTPGASQAMAAAQSTLVRSRLDGAMRCDTLLGSTPDLEAGGCAWANGGGTWLDQRGDGGYDGSTWGLGAGAQVALGEAWVIGGAAGFEQGSFDAADDVSSVDGTTGYLAVAVGRQFGGFALTGALSGSYGTFDTERTVVLPDVTRNAEGDTDVVTLGGRVRAAYLFEGAAGYVQPMVDLDLVYTHASGYEESGAGITNLSVEDSDQFAFIATPAVEVGARMMLGDSFSVGGFALAGLSLSTEDSWETDARLVAAPAAAGTFTTTLPIADVIANVGVGLEVSHAPSQFEARIEYNGAFGDEFSSHGGLLRLTKRF